MYIILFDIDGTLLNSGGAGKAAIEAALLEDFGLPALRTQVSYSGRTDRSIIRDLLRFHELAETPENFARLIAGYLRRLPDSLRQQQGKILPGIAELLQQLAKRDDVVLGLLTGNLVEGAKLKLGHFGLFDFFAFGSFGDRHWERNDVAREALEAVRKHLDGEVDPSQIWVIGDTPLDVACARAIGAKAVAVATGWHSLDELAQCHPDVLLPDLANAQPLLKLWQ
jgi:phosphoglycolate phosphatase-like HAD superfamily hydrolase